jgi:hypothetical protein
LASILNGSILIPNTLNTKQSNRFFKFPSRDNVKAVIVKKIRIPIFDRWVVRSCAFSLQKYWFHPVKDLVELKDLNNTHPASSCASAAVSESQPQTPEQKLRKENERLKQENKRLRQLIEGSKPEGQRRRDLLSDSVKPCGYKHYLLAVVKSGVVEKGCSLDYVGIEAIAADKMLPCFTVQSIVEFDQAVDKAPPKDVEQVSVTFGKDCVVLLEVTARLRVDFHN